MPTLYWFHITQSPKLLINNGSHTIGLMAFKNTDRGSFTVKNSREAAMRAKGKA